MVPAADNVTAAGWAPRAGLATLELRSSMRRSLRQRLHDAGLFEFEPSLLLSAPVTDTALHSVTLTLRLDGQRYYLHTSPEYQMKRLLAAGAGDCYALTPVFRDGEAGRRHQPEFALLEWYRLGFDESAIVADTLATIGAALTPAGLSVDAIETTYRQAFVDAIGLDPIEATDAAVHEAALAIGCPVGLDRDGELDNLLSLAVAPTFDPGSLTVVRRFPASQAALAALADDDERESLRFEVFAGSLELANGFVELTDANEQRRRFDEDNRARRELGLPTMPVDESLLAALESGLPASAGVAVGFDRLVMLATGADSIADVCAFPFVSTRSGNTQ